jgi:hypothetical protein
VLSLGSGLVLNDRYRLEQSIGRGGMGEVWRATDLRLRRPVAIKVLPADRASDQQSVARFRREAETAAALQHPGITVVFDIDAHRDTTGETVFLVMELLDGKDLRTVIDAAPGGVPVAQAVAYTTQVADALAAAHARGIVHRDIKPQNLMVSPEGRVRLCDFGIAHLMVTTTELTAAGSSLGTPSYMAPEQFRAEPIDPRTDLYALGCVLYELLTGAKPFDGGGNPHALMHQHLNQPPPAPRSRRPDVPEPLDRLVLDLLAKNPAERPPTADAVAAFLRSPAPAQATVAQPAAAGPAPTGPANGDHREALIGGLAGLAVLVLVAVGAFVLLHDSGGQPSASRSIPARTRTTGSPGTAVPSPTAVAGGPLPTGMAKPGQTYRIGQTAQVPFVNGGNEKLALTVTSIEKGTSADLAALKNSGEQTDGMTPFYARYTAKNLGGGVSDLADTSNNMQGVLQDRRTMLPTLVSGDFPKCADHPPNNGELPKGASYQACALFLAPSGDTVAGVEWTQSQTDTYSDPHGVYWK